MNTLKNIAAYPIGGVVGAIGGYMVATKLVKTDNVWYKAGLAVGFAALGSYLASMYSEKKTAGAVKK